MGNEGSKVDGDGEPGSPGASSPNRDRESTPPIGTGRYADPENLKREPEDGEDAPPSSLQVEDPGGTQLRPLPDKLLSLRTQKIVKPEHPASDPGFEDGPPALSSPNRIRPQSPPPATEPMPRIPLEPSASEAVLHKSKKSKKSRRSRNSITAPEDVDTAAVSHAEEPAEQTAANDITEPPATSAPVADDEAPTSTAKDAPEARKRQRKGKPKSTWTAVNPPEESESSRPATEPEQGETAAEEATILASPVSDKKKRRSRKKPTINGLEATVEEDSLPNASQSQPDPNVNGSNNNQTQTESLLAEDAHEAVAEVEISRKRKDAPDSISKENRKSKKAKKSAASVSGEQRRVNADFEIELPGMDEDMPDALNTIVHAAPQPQPSTGSHLSSIAAFALSRLPLDESLLGEGSPLSQDSPAAQRRKRQDRKRFERHQEKPNNQVLLETPSEETLRSKLQPDLDHNQDVSMELPSHQEDVIASQSQAEDVVVQPEVAAQSEVEAQLKVDTQPVVDAQPEETDLANIDGNPQQHDAENASPTGSEPVNQEKPETRGSSARRTKKEQAKVAGEIEADHEPSMLDPPASGTAELNGVSEPLADENQDIEIFTPNRGLGMDAARRKKNKITYSDRKKRKAKGKVFEKPDTEAENGPSEGEVDDETTKIGEDEPVRAPTPEPTAASEAPKSSAKRRSKRSFLDRQVYESEEAAEVPVIQKPVETTPDEEESAAAAFAEEAPTPAPSASKAKKSTRKSDAAKTARPTPRPEQKRTQQPNDHEESDQEPNSSEESDEEIPKKKRTSSSRKKGIKYVMGVFTEKENGKLREALEEFRLEEGLSEFKANELIHMNPQGLSEAARRARSLFACLHAALPQRPPRAINNRARLMFHNFSGRGVFTREEDQEIRELVQSKGQKWAEIGQIVNRSQYDVRDRWRNFLVCGDNRKVDFWSEEEEVALVQLVLEAINVIQASRNQSSQGIDAAAERDLAWDRISQDMNRTRSAKQCREKWQLLRERQKRIIDGSFDEREDRITQVVETARSDLKRMTPEDKYHLIKAIRDTAVGLDSKIPWETLGDAKFRKSWKRETLRIMWGRLRKTVRSEQSMTTRAAADALIDRYKKDNVLSELGESDVDDAAEISMFDVDASGKKKYRKPRLSTPKNQFEARLAATQSPSSVKNRRSRLSLVSANGNPSASGSSRKMAKAKPEAKRIRAPVQNIRSTEPEPRESYKSDEFIDDSDQEDGHVTAPSPEVPASPEPPTNPDQITSQGSDSQIIPGTAQEEDFDSGEQAETASVDLGHTQGSVELGDIVSDVDMGGHEEAEPATPELSRREKGKSRAKSQSPPAKLLEPRDNSRSRRESSDLSSVFAIEKFRKSNLASQSKPQLKRARTPARMPFSVTRRKSSASVYDDIEEAHGESSRAPSDVEMEDEDEEAHQRQAEEEKRRMALESDEDSDMEDIPAQLPGRPM